LPRNRHRCHCLALLREASLARDAADRDAHAALTRAVEASGRGIVAREQKEWAAMLSTPLDGRARAKHAAAHAMTRSGGESTARGGGGGGDEPLPPWRPVAWPSAHSSLATPTQQAPLVRYAPTYGDLYESGVFKHEKAPPLHRSGAAGRSKSAASLARDRKLRASAGRLRQR